MDYRFKKNHGLKERQCKERCSRALLKLHPSDMKCMLYGGSDNSLIEALGVTFLGLGNSFKLGLPSY